MQKVVKFLEAYVQWVALGLGLLWVLWMGYSYWASSPVVANLGTEKVAPADIEDELLKSSAVDGLDKAHSDEGPYPLDLRDKLKNQDHPEFVKDFRDRISNITAPESSSSPFCGGVPQIVRDAKTEDVSGGVATLPDIGGTLVLETSPTGDAAATGMSVVKRPDPTVPVLANQPNQPNQPNQEVITPPDTNLANMIAQQNGAQQNPGPNGQPQQPATPQPIAVVPEEVTWVTVSGTLDMKKLSAAFQKAQVPAQAAFTSILRVELVRQELQPNGDWGAEQAVKDLTNEFRPAFPSDPNANPADQVAYLQWAQQHVADLVEPAFYEVLRGQIWKTAAMPDVTASTDAQPTEFDPAKVLPGQVSKLPPDQRAIWYKWHQDQEKQKAPPPRPATPAPSGGGRNTGGAFFAPPPQQTSRFAPRPGDTAAERPIGAGPTAVPASLQQPPQVQPQPQAQPGQPQPQVPQPQDLPQAPFSPAQQTKDLEVWAHDETTVPGKVYRYKLRLWIKNPLFGTQGMAKDANATNVFALKADTDWSKPLPSPSKHDFFVTNGGSLIGGIPKVGVDYFNWEDGEWKKTPLSVQPGDRIGETTWTVVDLRPVGSGSGENRVLLVSDTGDVSTRYYKNDRANPRYAQLNALLAPVAPPPGAPNPGQPTPAPVNPPRPPTGGFGGGANPAH